MALSSGDAAPTFALTDENGKLVSTDAMRGKKYVLYFYPKDDTPGCTVEACQFNDNLTAFQSLAFQCSVFRATMPRRTARSRRSSS